MHANLVFAQTESVAKKVTNLEVSSNHKLAIEQLKLMLQNKTLTLEDRLLMHTALIHNYQELQQWDSCLNYCHNEITIAKQQGNLLAEATFFKLIGNTYYHIPDKEKAAEYWERSISISSENKFDVLLEQCYHNVGAVYLENGNHFDTAEQYLLRSLNLGLKNNRVNSIENNRHNRLLATLYERTNKLPKAELLYLQLIESNKLLNDTAQLAEALMFYSDVLRKQSKFDKAIQVSAEALLLAKKINQLDMTQTALEFYAANLFAAGNFEKAYKAEAALVEIVRKRFSVDLNNKLNNTELKYKNA